MHLLITGGAGFIGARLIRQWLDRPELARLVNLDALTYAADLERLAGLHGVHPRCVFERVDLRDRAAVAEVVARHAITHVVHLAAETHVDRSIASAEIFVQSNVLGTLHLLEACRELWDRQRSSLGASAPGLRPQAPRFVHVSTDEVYGALAPEAPPFTEASPLAPNSPYAASKAAADCLVRAFIRTHGFPAAITRCSNNYGPGQHAEKLIPTVLQALRARRPIPVYGDGRQVRDWLHADDHAEALWAVLRRGRAGEVYNIGGGCEWPNLELIGRLCDAHDAVHPGADGPSRALIRHVADRPGHDRRYAIDSRKLRAETGWAPRRDFAEGLRELVTADG